MYISEFAAAVKYGYVTVNMDQMLGSAETAYDKATMPEVLQGPGQLRW